MQVGKGDWKGLSGHCGKDLWEFLRVRDKCGNLLLFILRSQPLLWNIFLLHGRQSSSLLIGVKRSFPSCHLLISIPLVDATGSLPPIFPYTFLVTFFSASYCFSFCSCFELAIRNTPFFSRTILFQFNWKIIVANQFQFEEEIAEFQFWFLCPFVLKLT